MPEHCNITSEMACAQARGWPKLPRMLFGDGNPNGSEVGYWPNDQYLDELTGILYTFNGTPGTKIGWAAVSGFVNIQSFGARGDGVTDDTSDIQASINSLTAGQTLLFPIGTYKTTSTLSIPANIRILGYGAKIINDTAAATILSIDSGVKIYGLEIEGTGNSTANANGIAISIIGTVGTYKADILIEDCYIHDIAFYGILAEFAERVSVRGGKIFNIGYAAVMGLSVSDFFVGDSLHIKGITPGSSGNAYGVAFTRRTTDSLAVYPRSSDCKVVGITVEDNTIWEGLDTHAGNNILFLGNTIINCKIGIAVVSDNGTNAPLNCRVIGNNISGATGYGIAFTGAPDVLGSPFAYATGLIQGNTLYDCGYENNGNSGAIYMVATKGVSVVGNTLKDSRSNGICLYYDNASASISGNTIKDVWDNTYSVPAGIALRSEYNSATITGNTLKRENAALGTFVSVRGVNIATTSNNETIIGHNENNFTTPYFGFSPAFHQTGSDSALDGIIVDPALGEVSIGGDSLNYKLNVRGDQSGHSNLILARNTTPGGRAVIQVASDSSAGGFKAFSSTFGNARKDDKIGIELESISAAIGFWAETSGQTIDFYAGGTTRTVQHSSGGTIVGSGTIDPSAALQADSTTKGFLPPRMTKAQRDAISSPAEGLLIRQTDGNVGIHEYRSGAWYILDATADP